MREKNISNQIIKESIFKALMILMGQKNFYKISITEITNKAGVSRMSFYRNYDSKEEIITDYLDSFFECHLHHILISENHNLLQNLTQYFAYFRKNKQLMSNLIEHELISLLEKKNSSFICSLLSKSDIKECKKRGNQYQMQYITGGMIYILTLWATNDMKETDEEMADTTLRLILKCEA